MDGAHSRNLLNEVMEQKNHQDDVPWTSRTCRKKGLMALLPASFARLRGASPRPARTCKRVFTTWRHLYSYKICEMIFPRVLLGLRAPREARTRRGEDGIFVEGRATSHS